MSDKKATIGIEDLKKIKTDLLEVITDCQHGNIGFKQEDICIDDQLIALENLLNRKKLVSYLGFHIKDNPTSTDVYRHASIFCCNPRLVHRTPTQQDVFDVRKL